MTTRSNDGGLIVFLLFVISLNTCQSCRCSTDPQLDSIDRNVSRGADELVEIHKRLEALEKKP
jgi:hypothetical protein